MKIIIPKEKLSETQASWRYFEPIQLDDDILIICDRVFVVYVFGGEIVLQQDRRVYVPQVTVAFLDGQKTSFLSMQDAPGQCKKLRFVIIPKTEDAYAELFVMKKTHPDYEH